MWMKNYREMEMNKHASCSEVDQKDFQEWKLIKEFEMNKKQTNESLLPICNI